MKHINTYKLFESILSFREYRGLIASNNYNELKKQIDNGLDVNLSDHKNITLLTYAVYSINYEITKLLLESGADINLASITNNQPINVLAQVIYGINYDLTDDDDEINILKLLLKYGADLNNKNDKDKDFFDIITFNDTLGKNTKFIISQIPEEYEMYLKKKKSNEFNL